jgi:hypothetical protein
MTKIPKEWGKKNTKKGWVKLDYPGKKIFSPVSFTTVSGASFGENFFLMTLIAEHPLTLSFPPFFVIGVSIFI